MRLYGFVFAILAFVVGCQFISMVFDDGCYQASDGFVIGYGWGILYCVTLVFIKSATKAPDNG